MNGLEGARVIIVDDKDEEALPVLKALAGMGVPSVFFNPLMGSHSLPSSRLKGIRLAILDMDLVGAGADDKSKASTLVNTIGGILDPDNGPYSVIIWTMHEELIDLFKDYIYKAPEVPKPILTFKITKDECKKGGVFELDAVQNKLLEGLSKFGPLLFLQTWEANSIQAAIDVTNLLSELADSSGDDLASRSETWSANLLQMMKSLAEEEAGMQLDKSNCLSSLYGALNPLHADRMNNLSNLPKDLFTNEVEKILGVRAKIGHDITARINSMLHLSYDNLDRISPGCIYVYRYRDKRPVGVPTWSSLLDDLIQPSKNKPDIKALLRNDCLLMIVEISPVCDHAQKKVRIPRFIPGFLIPTKHLKYFKRDSRGGSFMWDFGPLHIEIMNKWKGGHHFCLSARHIFSLGFDEIEYQPPFTKLRPQVLAEIQNWVAYYISRPGVMQLR